VHQVRSEPARGGMFERMADGICRRAFSAPEAMAYELTIAQALAAALEPVIRPRLRGRRVLDVGCGGGQIAQRIMREGSTVVGIDPSRSQMRRFRRQTGGAAGAAVATAGALPFSGAAFDSLYSSCAWKHWPVPTDGMAECIRVTKPGGAVVVVEIDGSATREEFWTFARTSRMPFGLRKAYLGFAMRTVVGVAPSREDLSASFEHLPVDGVQVERIDGMPFLLATATVRPVPFRSVPFRAGP
jgi:ubiquinone/menaquinone biosynthesis C-methylase UbiE